MSCINTLFNIILIYWPWTHGQWHHSSGLMGAYLTHIFSVRQIVVFSFRALDSTSVLCLGAILNSDITNKMQKNVALNKMWKGQDMGLQYESWNKKVECCLVWPLTSALNMSMGGTQIFCCSAYVQEWLAKSLECYFGVTSKL